MTRPLSTHDIDLAACYMAITGNQPACYLRPGDHLAIFEIPNNELTMPMFSEYATGSLMLPIKRFCSCRSFLYKKMKEARRW